MEDKTVNKNEVTQEQAAEPVVKKEGFFGKLGRKFKKPDAAPADNGTAAAEPKEKFIDKVKRNKGKIAAVAAGSAAVAYGVMKIVANSKPGVTCDPDFETEPGDWEPEDLYASEEAVEENSTEEVNAE